LDKTRRKLIYLSARIGRDAMAAIQICADERNQFFCQLRSSVLGGVKKRRVMDMIYGSFFYIAVSGAGT